MAKVLENLVIADVGSHILDLVRYFMGEAQSIYCQHLHVRADIRGEMVASLSVKLDHAIADVLLSFASFTEDQRFPEVTLLLEGDQGSIELKPGFRIVVTDKTGSFSQLVPPPHYPWANPEYDINHASMVPLHENFIRGLRGGPLPETHSDDNLKTMRLVYAAYESAQKNEVVKLT